MYCYNHLNVPFITFTRTQNVISRPHVLPPFILSVESWFLLYTCFCLTIVCPHLHPSFMRSLSHETACCHSGTPILAVWAAPVKAGMEIGEILQSFTYIVAKETIYVLAHSQAGFCFVSSVHMRKIEGTQISWGCLLDNS